MDDSVSLRFRGLAERFRLGDCVSASLELPDLLARLASMLPPNDLAVVVPVFGDLLAALERKDWLGLADGLEFDLLKGRASR